MLCFLLGGKHYERCDALLDFNDCVAVLRGVGLLAALSR